MVSHDIHWMYNNSVPLKCGQDVWVYLGCSWFCVLSFKFSDFVISTSKVNKAEVASMTIVKVQRDRFIMFPTAEKSGLRFHRHINPVTVFSPMGTRDKLQALKSSYIACRLQMVSAVMCIIFRLTKECSFAKYSSWKECHSKFCKNK
jgi:hypothetical protein